MCGSGVELPQFDPTSLGRISNRPPLHARRMCERRTAGSEETPRIARFPSGHLERARRRLSRLAFSFQMDCCSIQRTWSIQPQRVRRCRAIFVPWLHTHAMYCSSTQTSSEWRAQRAMSASASATYSQQARPGQRGSMALRKHGIGIVDASRWPRLH
jgi:hypothetical protein